MADFLGLVGGIGQSGFIGRAVVGLDLDTRKYQAELAAAKAQTEAGTTSMAQRFSALGTLAKTGLLAAAAGVVVFAANSVRAASDLGEAVNKSNEIFEGNAAEIEAWAATGADAFGLSKTAALDAAGGFGQMLQTAELSVGASAEMSRELVELAADLASFNNIDPTEGLEKLRAGLAGEAEPLRQLGVFLSEARVQTEAYTSGIAKSGEELTEAQKIQARYNIIFQDSIKAQGDFARTSESLPNQMRTLKAEFENLAATAGQALIPVLAALLSKVNDLIGPLTELIEAFNELGTFTPSPEILAGMESWEAAAGRAGEMFRAGILSAGEYEEALRMLSGRFEGDQPVLVRQVEHVLALADAYSEGKDKQGFLIGAMHEGTTVMEEQGRAAGRAREEIVKFAHMTGKELEEWRVDTKAAIEGSIQSLEDLSTESDITSNDFIKAHQRMLDAAREMAQNLREISREDWVNRDYVRFLAEQGPEWLSAFADLTESQQRRAQEAWERSREKTDSAKESLDRITGALDKIDRSESKHKVTIEYEYKGFDPTKPGMAGVQRSG